jgi:hypothetical protein
VRGAGDGQGTVRRAVRAAAPRRAEPGQGTGQGPGGPGPQRPVVGQHLDQQGHRLVRLGAGPGPAEGPAQRGERQHHQVVSFTQVSPLMREHRGQFGRP